MSYTDIHKLTGVPQKNIVRWCKEKVRIYRAPKLAEQKKELELFKFLDNYQDLELEEKLEKQAV